MNEHDKMIMCEGKDGMPASVAKQTAKRMRNKYKANVSAYRCRACGQWHVGGRPKGIRGGTKGYD